ncbi:MAG: recombinase family protein [Rhodopirellula sp.]|nr:recombinase family protein [Rhodopirellula sp.]
MSRRRQRQRERSVTGDGNANVAASYSRFSSAQQQSEARRKAESNGHDLRVDQKFSDEAVSGTRRNRLGLNEMLRAAAAGEFKVLYFYSIRQLVRESVITMPILK